MYVAIKNSLWVLLASIALTACSGEIDRRDELGLEEEGVRSEVVELKGERPIREEPVAEREAEFRDPPDGAQLVDAQRQDGELALVKYDPTGEYTVQVGGYRDEAKANALVRELIGAGYPAYAIARPGSREVRVRIGYFKTQTDAEYFGKRFRADRTMEYWVDKRENE